ncbi:hypothetical protein LSCM1_03156 [Leishmania martiniquensis]|uniref:Uncharacterized protein n=1 Tax=Leishmania martiniquensis TaxID=1580590 RepID=A0A836GG16_9TRYP|nr:hypothetical protein LSCM1_03156 [Leishmania martiniquensis]
MAEHQQPFSARAALPKDRVAPIESMTHPSSVSVRITAATCAPAQLPRIQEKAWYFYTALRPLIERSTGHRDGSEQEDLTGQSKEDAAGPSVLHKGAERVGSPNAEGQTSSDAPREPAPAFCMEANRLFFEDVPSHSGSDASLADLYSLRTLYASRCVSLGMRQPCDHVLRQLPCEAGRDAANELRALVARDTYVPAKVCQALTVLLPYCTELEYLDLCNSGLRSNSGFMTGVNALLDALICSVRGKAIAAALHTIDLSFNQLNDRTGWRLVRLIQRRPRLRVVNTEGTEISDKVKAHIAEELRRNLTARKSPMAGGETDAEETMAATATQPCHLSGPLERLSAVSVPRGNVADEPQGRLSVVRD